MVLCPCHDLNMSCYHEETYQLDHWESRSLAFHLLSFSMSIHPCFWPAKIWWTTPQEDAGLSWPVWASSLPLPPEVRPGLLVTTAVCAKNMTINLFKISMTNVFSQLLLQQEHGMSLQARVKMALLEIKNKKPAMPSACPYWSKLSKTWGCKIVFRFSFGPSEKSKQGLR